jgi:predicted DNA-binding transcriptional regulator YafY
MYHPTTRLLTVLEILQSRQRIGGHELAERLEVDVRTVRRYVMMLQELGIPVESVRGRYGTYRLRPGFKLPPMMFTEDEALAVVLGLLIARRSGLSDAAPAVEGALAKIERVLPIAVRERVQAVQDILTFAISMPEDAADSTFVIALSAAAQRRQRVWLRYRAWHSETTEREFDPYGVVHRAGRWYTVGFCHLRQDVRVFRLDRMLEVEPVEATFSPPPDFDCLARVERAIAQTPGTWQVEVLLHTTLDDARQQISPTLATLDESAEGVVMRCFVEELDWMARVLSRLACPFVIRHPPQLRDELRKTAQRLFEIAAEDTEDPVI